MGCLTHAVLQRPSTRRGPRSERPGPQHAAGPGSGNGRSDRQRTRPAVGSVAQALASIRVVQAHGIAHAKLDASAVSPLPVYLAIFGYGQTGRVNALLATVGAAPDGRAATCAG